MVILYKDPKGERIFNRSMSQAQAAMTGLSLNDAERDKLHDLERHCKDLETRLGKYEVDHTVNIIYLLEAKVNFTILSFYLSICNHSEV